MDWKITLDVPHSYATEQGGLFSKYAQDFRDSPNCYSSTWRCPVTGVVMLNPSFRKRNFADDFRGLDNWRYGQSAISYWRSISKSLDSVSMFTSQRPAGQLKFFDAITTGTGLFILNAADGFYDNLEWALESTFTLNIDEAFAIHYRGLTDELLRKNNWFAVQWDDIYIHVSHGGHVTVCWYPDRGDLSGTPEVVHEFDIADAGDLLGKNGQFVFLPMPGRGLLMYHLLGSSKQNAFLTNAGNYAMKGSHLIPWNARKVGAHYRLFETSQVRLALNPFHANNIGFQNITFPESGNYTEEVFDPGYKPSLDPSDVAALTLTNFGANFSTIAVDLRKADNSGLWTAGTDRQGRVKIFLTTSDSRYTPFVYGWGVEWQPVFQTRNTTPVEITDGYEDVLQRLEMTTDSEGNFEGSADLKLQTSAAIIIMERGDCTFQIEYSEDSEEWTVFNGGLCKFGEPEMMYHPDWGFYWQVTANLHGQEERFEELFNTIGTAFDGAMIADALNIVFTTSGFAAIDTAEMPAALQNIKVPPLPTGTNYRFHPRFGDRLKHTVALLLFMARTQHNEYKRVYDWENEVWTVVRRPRGEEDEDVPDSFPWTLTWEQDIEDHDERIAFYNSLKPQFQPTEATFFTVVGVAEEQEGQPKLYQSAPITNDLAVTDFEIDGEPNYDYTGRHIGVRFVAPGIGSVEDANKVARKINPRFFHRNILATVMLVPGHMNLALAPDVKVNLKLPPIVGTEEEREFEMWIKTQTIIVNREDCSPYARMTNETMILHLDHIWENSFKEGQ